MNRVTRLQFDRTCRLAPAAPAAACTAVLSACPGTLFVGMSAPALAAAGTMYAVAFEAARRQVERERAVRIAAPLN